MMSTSSSPSVARRSTASFALILASGALIAVASNAIVATSALAAGASNAFPPLQLPALASLTIVGYVLAFVGWRVIVARVPRSAAALKIVVPLVTLVSLIPDGVLLATGFIPGSSGTATVALALMHLVVVAVVVPVAQRISPAH